MLKIIKKLMEHYDTMSTPEYWENEENFSFAPVVDYVANDFPKLILSNVMHGISSYDKYKYAANYIDLLSVDIKSGFYLDLTDEKVEEKNIAFSQKPVVETLQRYLKVYFKVTYCNKLNPEKQITIYYVFQEEYHNMHMCCITGKGPTRLIRNKNGFGRIYQLLPYLLVNSIDVKTPQDFDKLDIVIPCMVPFEHKFKNNTRDLGLIEISNLLKEEQDPIIKKELMQHRQYLISSVVEKMICLTETVLYELLPKQIANRIGVEKDAEKRLEREEQEKLKAYQDKLRRERLANTQRLQRQCWGI